jgi:hypothetical protein
MLRWETGVDPQGFVVAGFALPNKNIGHMEKKLVFAALLLLIGFPSFSHASTLVSPYYRGDTFVDPYYRTDADSNPYNNYGFPGNYNPNTGKTTTGNPDTYLSNYYGIGSSVGGSSNADLYKTLNAGGLKTVPLPDPSEKLFKELQDFQNELEQEKKTIDDRLYQLQLKNSTGIFASCVYPSSLGCTTESQYSSMRALDAATGINSTDKLSQCRSQIDTYQQKLNEYNQCVSTTQNQALDSIADKAVELAKLKSESAYYQSLIAQKQKESANLHVMVQQVRQQVEACQSSHGSLATYNGNTNQCKCRDGMAPDTGSPYQCIPLVIWCKVESGIGATNKVDVYVDSVNRDVICKCDTGYQWDTSSAKCIQTVAPVKMTRAEYQAKYGTAPGTTLSLSEIDPSRVTTTAPAVPAKKLFESSDIEIKKPKAAIAPTSTTSTSFRVLVAATTSSSDQVSSTQSKSPQKQNLLQKLRSFLFGWWR